ncbi:hypothetical protein ANCCAN_30421 [Ancylostoma caninum]|uniref:Acetophenone carboxylase-like C-terminal domain-containing protein n=1 Tax=Ancylostoma caninum TaxID=29170 RepID=A0A368EYS2_ANCCA|nr:hypothetical protein ANCCAN_30421 [Ancylostoma caninum]
MIAERFAALSERATNELSSQGFAEVHCEYFLHMRFARTDCAIMVTANYEPQDTDTLLNFVRAFKATYKREFGFILEDRDIIIDDIRIRGVASSGVERNERMGATDDPEHPVSVGSSRTFFEGGFLDTSIYNKKDLLAGHIIRGPAMIIDRNR